MLVGLYMVATPGAAQMQPASPVSSNAAEAAYSAPDPERVEAARELLDILMPQEQREAMMVAMIEPMIANLEAGMMQTPDLEAALADNPDVRALFMEFMAAQRARALESAAANLPSMVEAMSRAYARRFTRREMREIGEFVQTDTGRAFAQSSFTATVSPQVMGAAQSFLPQLMQAMPNIVARIETATAHLPPPPGRENRESSAAPDRPVTTSNLDAMRGETQASEPETEE